MTKKATLQVRMDADLKEKAEELYRNLGTSFAEAVRIFAKQSVQENGMPFVATVNRENIYGRLSEYSKPLLVAEEEGAYGRTMVESDSRNYTAVINEVTYGNRVYLTRNGHGAVAVVAVEELDELDKQKAMNQLLLKLQEAEKSVREEGTISADEMEAELEVL